MGKWDTLRWRWEEGRGVVSQEGEGGAGWRRTQLEKEGEERQCRSDKVGEECD